MDSYFIYFIYTGEGLYHGAMPKEVKGDAQEQRAGLLGEQDLIPAGVRAQAIEG